VEEAELLELFAGVLELSVEVVVLLDDVLESLDFDVLLLSLVELAVPGFLLSAPA